MGLPLPRYMMLMTIAGKSVHRIFYFLPYYYIYIYPLKKEKIFKNKNYVIMHLNVKKHQLINYSKHNKIQL